MRRDLDQALVLVGGARRSGTHWLQRILSTHPDVEDVPTETYLFSRGIVPLLERFQHGSPAAVRVGQVYTEREDLRLALRQVCDTALGPYLDRAPSRPTRLLERTPEHVTVTDVATWLYPKARVVHIVRDPDDVVASLLHQPWGPTDATEAAREWRETVATARALARDLPHYVEVTHAELRADPEQQVRRLFEWLDLPVGDEVVADAVEEAGRIGNRTGEPPGLTRRQRRAIRRVLDAETGEPGKAEVEPPVGSPPRRQTPDDRQAQARGPQVELETSLEVLRAVRPVDDLLGLVSDDVHLAAGTTRTWRGRDAVRALVDHVHATDSMSWPIAEASQHIADAMGVAITTHRGDGTLATWTVVVRIGPPGITELAVHAAAHAPPTEH